MDAEELKTVDAAAESAVAYARDVRAMHRKKSSRGTAQRESDIQFALERLKRAMAPIRSELARIGGDYYSSDAVDIRLFLKALSRDIQRERRKLWKMQAKQRKEPKRGTSRRRRGSAAAGPSDRWT